MADCPPPIFIVGAPRSGTTLLATLLASHRRLSCGAETHFFPYLEANRSQLESVVKARNWPQRATEFVLDLALEDHPIHELFGLERQAIHSYLSACPPSLAALLESITVPHMAATGKRRWAEKTPNHLLHLDFVRRLYPAAQIVRIVRDPRDSAISMAKKLPWASTSPLHNAYLIDRWHRRSRAFFRQDPHTYTLRYEDLVNEPASSLQTLCAFLEEPFQVEMLATQAAAQHTVPTHETWKQQVSQRLDASRCYAWQQQPSQDRTRLEAVSLVCQEMIEAFDYAPLESDLRPIFAQYISDRFVKSHSTAIQFLLEQGSLLVPCQPQNLQSETPVLYCDMPLNGDNWRKNVKRFGRFCGGLGMLKSRRVKILLSELCRTAIPKCNIFGRIAAFLLKRLGQPADLTDFVDVSPGG